MPGVRMTVTTKGLSASVGSKGNRVTINSKGGVTQTVGIPGTGISYSKRSGGGSRAPRSSSAPRSVGADAPIQPPHVAAKPGMLAPKWEKELYRAVTTGAIGSLGSIASRFPEARHTCMVLDAFAGSGSEQSGALFEEVWRSGYRPEDDRFLQTYMSRSTGTVGIAPGVYVTMPLNRDLIGLTLAEFRQAQGDLPGAIEAIESLDPTFPAAVSLAELYNEAGRHAEVIELTNGVTNEDDFTSFLLAQRGVAFTEQGYFDAAREAFKQSLARRSQAQAIKHNTLAHRAETYRREGKRAMARKDLERILADDPAFPGLAAALAEVS
ncbi:hypothetical protein BW733_08220 [Tessaracoccus flavescens]|uniref:DUF4236 domain-containing protein n=1 Tax=Tessaracoccus flavescens TaxID=399497 RepID=A0A1Q2CXJ6_9ACTN|nr:hypothetical protein BW733_08220 [Tessaracoccus flavescens]